MLTLPYHNHECIDLIKVKDLFPLLYIMLYTTCCMECITDYIASIHIQINVTIAIQ